MHAGIPPPPRAGTPPGAGIPREQAPPPGAGTPHPRRKACWEIRSMRGRYASYWNAIVFSEFFSKKLELTCEMLNRQVLYPCQRRSSNQHESIKI